MNAPGIIVGYGYQPAFLEVAAGLAEHDIVMPPLVDEPRQRLVKATGTLLYFSYENGFFGDAPLQATAGQSIRQAVSEHGVLDSSPSVSSPTLESVIPYLHRVYAHGFSHYREDKFTITNSF